MNAGEKIYKRHIFQLLGTHLKLHRSHDSKSRMSVQNSLFSFMQVETVVQRNTQEDGKVFTEKSGSRTQEVCPNTANKSRQGAAKNPQNQYARRSQKP